MESFARVLLHIDLRGDRGFVNFTTVVILRLKTVIGALIPYQKWFVLTLRNYGLEAENMSSHDKYVFL